MAGDLYSREQRAKWYVYRGISLPGNSNKMREEEAEAMKVSNRMIHKDVRLAGAVLRLFTSHVTVEGYRKARASSEKKIDQALPRRAKMEKVYLKRPDGSQMRMVILKPAHAAKKVPAVLFLHGGGYVLGTPEEKIGFMEDMMEAADCVMMAPDYTLALDEPYPAALKDAYQALLWMKEHGGEYGARDDQLFVMGESAGGRAGSGSVHLRTGSGRGFHCISDAHVSHAG